VGGTVFFVVFAGIVIIAFVVARRIEMNKRAKAAAFAASLGLEYRHGPMDPPAIPFQQFSIGRARKVSHVFWKAGDPYDATVFEYRYTTGSGKNSRTHRFTCATFRTNTWAPHLVLDRQGMFRGLLNSLGLRDIQVESPQFNDTWHVSCNDERFAITLLDPPMIMWLMSLQGGAGAVEIELLGNRGVAIMRPIPMEQMPGLLTYCHQFVTQIPRVLSDLYPRPA
jgi:hypothetical protein